MQDLDRRFRSLDTLSTPDVWDEVVARELHPPPSSRRPKNRMLTVVAAFGLFAAAGLFAWRALSPSETTTASLPPRLPPSPTAPSANGSTRLGDLGLRIGVPDGWHLQGFTTGFGPGAISGVDVSNVLRMPVALGARPIQASSEGFPPDGVSLVIYEGTWQHSRITTLPLSTSDFVEGSAPAGSPTLSLASFTGNGRTYVVTLKSGPNASANDVRAATKAIRSITYPASPDFVVRQTLTLKSGRDFLKLAPPVEVGDLRVLTAKGAIDRYERVNHVFKLPPDSTIWFGAYTAAVGDGTYRYHNQLAYGIEYHACIPSPDPFASATPTHPTGCTRWLFLNAYTGKMMEDVGQQ